MLILGIIIVLLIASFILVIQADERWILCFMMILAFTLFGATIALLFPDTDYSNYSAEQISEQQIGNETKIMDISNLQVTTLIDEDEEEGKCQISYTKDGESMKINVNKKNVVRCKSETGKPYIIKNNVKKDRSVVEILMSIFSISPQIDTVYQVFK